MVNYVHIQRGNDSIIELVLWERKTRKGIGTYRNDSGENAEVRGIMMFGNVMWCCVMCSPVTLLITVGFDILYFEENIYVVSHGYLIYAFYSVIYVIFGRSPALNSHIGTSNIANMFYDSTTGYIMVSSLMLYLPLRTRIFNSQRRFR